MGNLDEKLNYTFGFWMKGGKEKEILWVLKQVALISNAQKGEKPKWWLQLSQIVAQRIVELTCFVFWGPKQGKENPTIQNFE